MILVIVNDGQEQHHVNIEAFAARPRRHADRDKLQQLIIHVLMSLRSFLQSLSQRLMPYLTGRTDATWCLIQTREFELMPCLVMHSIYVSKRAFGLSCSAVSARISIWLWQVTQPVQRQTCF